MSQTVWMRVAWVQFILPWFLCQAPKSAIQWGTVVCAILEDRGWAGHRSGAGPGVKDVVDLTVLLGFSSLRGVLAEHWLDAKCVLGSHHALCPPYDRAHALVSGTMGS